MENGFGTNDILTGRGLGLYGFGGGYGMDLGYGNSVLAAGAHADGTAVASKLDCNQMANAASLDRISDQNQETRRILQYDDIKKAISDFRVAEASSDGQNVLALADRLAKMAADNAACCCETQKLILTEGNATRELINARALQDTQRDLDRALQDNQTQQIIAAITNSNGPKSLM